MESRITPNSSENSLDLPMMPSPIGTISWGAIFAGASIAIVLSLILLFLGSGLGLSAISPWAKNGISATTFGLGSILWITLTSIIASSIGGYVAGRLRASWTDTQLDEIHFRDTAHGLLAWAIATLVTATLLTSVISSMMSSAAKASVAMENNAMQAATISNDKETLLNTYFLDYLFRKDTETISSDSSLKNMSSSHSENITSNDSTPSRRDSENTHKDAKAQVTQIFMHALAYQSLSTADVKYAGQLISQETGKSQQEAEARVTSTFNAIEEKMRDTEIAARSTADKIRKASAYSTLWLFVSLLMGAFGASLMAVCGGRQRDQ